MNELLNQSLAQIVNNDHRTAAILEKYHLDFCCKGKRTLADACKEGAVAPEQVLTDLENIPQVPDKSIASRFDQFSLAQLCDYIVNMHHNYVRSEMPSISQYLVKVTGKHGDKHPELYKVLELFSEVRCEMDQHMQKEEVVLFPRIKDIESRAGSGSPLNIDLTYLFAPITVMESEHDHAGTAMEEIRQLTQDYIPPVGACTTFRLLYHSLQAFEADLHQHVHLENNILFPKALKLFGPGQCSLN